MVTVATDRSVSPESNDGMQNGNLEPNVDCMKAKDAHRASSRRIYASLFRFPTEDIYGVTGAPSHGNELPDSFLEWSRV